MGVRQLIIVDEPPVVPSILSVPSVLSEEEFVEPTLEEIQDIESSLPYNEYRDWPEGLIRWIEDHVCSPIYPEGTDIATWVQIKDLPDEPNPITGRSYKYLWESQKVILREAFKMENKRFLHNLIVFCWMRGDGKSFLACAVQTCKFFNWPRQQIVLGANSRDQIKFVHYDIIRDIILNSPKLLHFIGRANVKEKEIQIRDSEKRINSLIKPISSFTGIVSNITGFTFSEIFAMKNPSFYSQLYGSIRNVPNALGVIDSTVSDKKHILYQLYSNFIQKKTKLIYFSYRQSPNADHNDFWHPNMTSDQLNDYELSFPFGEFEKYFKNSWSAGSRSMFSDVMVAEMGYVGSDSVYLNHNDTSAYLDKRHEILEHVKDFGSRGLEIDVADQIIEIDTHLIPMEKFYSLKHESSATLEQLNNLGDVFDTDFVLAVGIDRADPTANASFARTILVLIAKGLPSSRTNPLVYLDTKGIPRYVYFVLALRNIEDHALEPIKDVITEWDAEFDGVDTICGERWGIWDLEEWSEELGAEFEAVYPNYDRQKESFSELYTAMKKGRFKAPAINVSGSKSEDILVEELKEFQHDVSIHWFGSPEKERTRGVQDDSVYTTAWGIWGARKKGVDDFRNRKKVPSFGLYIENKGLLGRY